MPGILVTGGAGFIGGYLVDALLRRGESVTVLDSLSASTHADERWPDHLPSSVRRVRGDVRSRESLLEALAGVDRIVHAAAFQDYRPEYSSYYAVNAVGTALLYEVLRERPAAIRRILVVSTQAVYGEGRYRCDAHGDVFPASRTEEALRAGDWRAHCPSCGSPLVVAATREDDPWRPLTVYGMSKLAGEQAALRIGAMLGIATAAARLSIVVGPRQSPRNLYSGALRSFAVALLRGDPVNVFEDGAQLRDFVPVADVVDALLVLLDREDVVERPVNVGGGVGTSVEALLHLVEDAVGRRAEVVRRGYYRVGETRDIVSDVSALAALGWKRREELGRAVEGYVRWLRDTGMWKAVRPVSIERFLADGAVRKVTE